MNILGPFGEENIEFQVKESNLGLFLFLSNVEMDHITQHYVRVKHKFSLLKSTVVNLDILCS